MEKFVFECDESDGCHYFIKVPVFVEYQSEEHLYVDMSDVIRIYANDLLERLKIHIKKKDINNAFNSSLYDNYFKFLDKEILLENFVYLKDNGELEIDFNISTLENYFSCNKLVK